MQTKKRLLIFCMIIHFVVQKRRVPGGGPGGGRWSKFEKNCGGPDPNSPVLNNKKTFRCRFTNIKNNLLLFVLIISMIFVLTLIN